MNFFGKYEEKKKQKANKNVSCKKKKKKSFYPNIIFVKVRNEGSK